MTDRPIIFSAQMVRALLDGHKTQTRRVLKPQPDLNGAGLWRYPPYVARNGSDPKRWVKRFGGFCQTDDDGLKDFLSPCGKRNFLPYAPDDRLWVREAWNCFVFSQDGEEAWPTDKIPTQAEFQECKEEAYRFDMQPVYRESDRARQWFKDQQWRSSIHMPRWASRITLTVTEVRVQRLQDISEADVLAEGCPCDPDYHDTTADGSNPHMVKIGPAKWRSPRAWYSTLWNSLHGPSFRSPDAWDANPWIAAYTFTVTHGNIDQIGGSNG